MPNHIVNHHIPKKAEGTYYTIPFPVPAGLEKITVSYSYRRKNGNTSNIVDLGLTDSGGRFLGWSGSARNTVFVGPHSSTNGYLMTDITPGEWRIIIGAYRIPQDGLDVRYEISYTPKAPHWLTGDLHMHSDASDGQHDIATLAKKAVKAGLDFIAVSNHNNYAENFHLPAVPGLTLIPAVEWTHYMGHMNFYGAAAPFENSFIANSEEEMLALAKTAKAAGALISANHPKCELCPYLWKSDNVFDIIEVWNGPMLPRNLRAIRWWHEMLCSGRKIPIVGGSDYHRDKSPVRLARPATRVFAASPSAKDILSAVSSGHSYITSSPSGTELELSCEGAMMGDSIEWRPGMEITIGASKLPTGSTVKLITSQGVQAQWKHFRHGKLEARLLVTKEWRFAYITVAQNFPGFERIMAVSNPVYCV